MGTWIFERNFTWLSWLLDVPSDGGEQGFKTNILSCWFWNARQEAHQRSWVPLSQSSLLLPLFFFLRCTCQRLNQSFLTSLSCSSRGRLQPCSHETIITDEGFSKFLVVGVSDLNFRSFSRDIIAANLVTFSDEVVDFLEWVRTPRWKIGKYNQRFSKDSSW